MADPTEPADDVAVAAANAAAMAANAAVEAAAEQREQAEEEVSAALSDTRLAYREQCVLMSLIGELTKYKKEEEAWAFDSTDSFYKAYPYLGGEGENACLQIEGEPYGFINQLTQYPDYKRFFDMTSAEISNLVPMIRLFKISQDDDGGLDDVEFNFDSHVGVSIPDQSDPTKTITNLENFIKDKNKRGFGVGIKDFTFSYVGSSPFSAKKSIEAKLTLFANSFDELLMCRGLGKCENSDFESRSQSYRYADLALRTGGKTLSSTQLAIEDTENNLPKLQFILKAVIGWAQPKNIPSADEQNLLTALYNSYVTLYLTPTVHEFNIGDQGQVTFTINYFAYIEDFFDQPNFDIFGDASITAKQIMRRIILKKLTSECETTTANEIKEAQADAIVKEKENNLKALSVSMVDNEKIRYLKLTDTDFQSFQDKGIFFTMSDDTQLAADAGDTSNANLSTALDGMIEDAENPNKPAEEDSVEENKLAELVDAGSHTIPYFFVSDLIDAVLKGIDKRLTDTPGELDALVTAISTDNSADFPDMKDKITIEDVDIDPEKIVLTKLQKQYKNLRVVLGPLEIIDPKTGTSSYISFGDLPVSFKYFIEWLTDKMLKKGEEIYNLGLFLHEFFNNLIHSFLNDDTCFKLNAKQRVRLQQIVLTSYPIDEFIDEVTQEIYDQAAGPRVEMSKLTKMPLLNISGPSGLPLVKQPAGEEKNYLIFFAGRVQPMELMNGIREEDEDRGIFHYLNGKDRGLIKKISLSKTTAKYLKMVRFEQEGYDGLQQLREVYDVTIDTLPIVTAFPGAYIFVDPKGFAPNTAQFGTDTAFDLTKYGIGGYHMIWKSEHSFGIGRAESKIYAKWVAEIAYEAEQTDQRSAAGTATSNTAKCRETNTEDIAAAAAAQQATEDAEAIDTLAGP